MPNGFPPNNKGKTYRRKVPTQAEERREFIVGRYKTVFPYYGGKTMMLPALLQLLPDHQTYVEAFGGSGTLLLNKPRRDRELEIYNDFESELVNFFRVLRDSRHALERVLKATPFSREEYETARTTLRSGDTGSTVEPLERARCWYILARQSFAATAGTGGWRVVKTTDPTQAWVNSIDLLSYFSERLSRVVLENMDWKELLQKYDGVDTLFYLDPPYTMHERSGGKAYRNDANDMHHVLMDFARRCKGKVILSGYGNPLYDEALKEWDRYTLKVRSSAANSSANAMDRREEVIWVKPNSRVRPSLWDSPVEELLDVEVAELV